jgi:hypothetical protein
VNPVGRKAAVLLALSITFAALSSPAVAGNSAIGVPPTKVDFGYLTFHSGGQLYGGGQWLIGLNWATIYPKKTRLDIGVGYVGAVFADPLADRHPVVTTKGTLVTDDDDQVIRLHGGYLELSYRVAQGSHWRTWASTRGELSSVDGEASLGGAARVSTEVWGGIAGADRDALALGVFALGIWVEASTRELGDRALVTAASAGMSIRIPLLVVGD